MNNYELYELWQIGCEEVYTEDLYETYRAEEEGE